MDANEVWMQTFTGKAVFPLNMSPADVDIKDIAHSLSMMCRFNGHCNRFYSVAEHCWRVALIAPKELRLQALMHDAAEAYLGDVISPLKCGLVLHGTPFKDHENNIERQVAEMCNMPYPLDPSIKTLDLTLLATECRDLMKVPPKPWPKMPKPLTAKILTTLQPEFAERTFLREYKNFTENK